MIEFTEEQIAALLEAVGLPTDTTDADVVVAAVADLATVERRDVAASAGTGLQLVPTDQLDALREAAATGERIAAAAADRKVDDALAEAVRRGAIKASRRDHWRTLLKADEDMFGVLASIADSTAVPMSEIGHAVDTEDTARDHAEWFR